MPTAAKQHTSYFNSINAPKAISQIKPRNLHALKFVPDTFEHIPSIYTKTYSVTKSASHRLKDMTNLNKIFF